MFLQSFVNQISDSDHAEQVSDPNFMAWLRMTFPDYSDDEYELLKYAGTPGSPVFENLSDEKKEEIENFLRNENIPPTPTP